VAASAARAAELQQVASRLDDPRVRARAHQAAGMTAMVSNDPVTATVELERALADLDAVGEPGVAGPMTQLSLAITVLFQGDIARASAICAQTRDICQARGDQWWLSHALSVASRIAFSAGDSTLATDYACQALNLAAPIGDLVVVAMSVERLAWLAGTAGSHERAAQLLGAADQMWQQLGKVMFGSSQWLRGHETCEADARAALGSERYATLFQRGAGLNRDDAVAFAYGQAPIPNRSLSEAPVPGAASNLTHREREVAELIAQGLPNRQIAAKLVISPRTAESHVENTLRKLGFTARSQVASWFVEQLHQP
jgi:DNA-binding CsgD family transcriptional regulator